MSLVSSYDNWKASGADLADTLPPPCPVCTGDFEAEPCGEECDALVKACERKNRIHGLRVSIRRAMWWARTYYGVDRRVDGRVLDIISRVNSYRREIKNLRRAA